MHSRNPGVEAQDRRQQDGEHGYRLTREDEDLVASVVPLSIRVFVPHEALRVLTSKQLLSEGTDTHTLATHL